MPKRKHASTGAGPSRKLKAEQEADEEPSLDEEHNSDISSEEGSPEDSSSDGYPSGDDSDEPSSDDDEDGEAFDKIDVDFEFFNAVEGDFHGLKTLLNNFLDGQQYACSELVDAVIAAPVGSVIKCGEGEDPIGVCTALELQKHQSSKFLADIKAFLEGHCPKATAGKLAAAWTSPGTVLLISERLLNCPPQLAPPLLESLVQEVAEALPGKVKQYLFVTRAYSDPSAPSDLIFATPEGEFLTKKASWTFDFPVANRAVGKDDLAPCRVVACVAAGAVGVALKQMADVVQG